MIEQSLEQWLMCKKKMSNRSAKDIVSRQKRVVKLINTGSIDEDTMNLLTANEQFLKMSVYVRSQLKRAVTLVLEYQETKNG